MTVTVVEDDECWLALRAGYWRRDFEEGDTDV